jgi:hypothetical protein
MARQELLQWRRPRYRRPAGSYCPNKLQELFAGAGGKAIERMGHDVGVNVLAEIKTNSHAARTGL